VNRGGVSGIGVPNCIGPSPGFPENHEDYSKARSPDRASLLKKSGREVGKLPVGDLHEKPMVVIAALTVGRDPSFGFKFTEAVSGPLSREAGFFFNLTTSKPLFGMDPGLLSWIELEREVDETEE
jgi:hypothetical protein